MLIASQSGILSKDGPGKYCPAIDCSLPSQQVRRQLRSHHRRAKVNGEKAHAQIKRDATFASLNLV